MLNTNPVLKSLQADYQTTAKQKSVSSLEDKYYKLACDIQDLDIARKQGVNHFHIRALEDKVFHSRNDIKSISKK